MKKRLLFPALALLALTFASCNKERNCECIVEDGDYNYNPVMVVDHSMKCSDITEMAIERKIQGADGEPTLERIEVHKVSCHDQRH